MYFDNNKYIVKEGSYIRLTPTSSFENNSYFKKWSELINSKKVSESNIKDLGQLNENVEFNSPSAAGSVVRAKATNGRTKWIHEKTDKTLKEYMASIESSNE